MLRKGHKIGGKRVPQEVREKGKKTRRGTEEKNGGNCTSLDSKRKGARIGGLLKVGEVPRDLVKEKKEVGGKTQEV